MNDDITAAMRQADVLRGYHRYAPVVKEVNQLEEIKRAAGLFSPPTDELKRIAEMRKITDVPDYLTSAVDKMNLASTIDITAPMMEGKAGQIYFSLISDK